MFVKLVPRLRQIADFQRVWNERLMEAAWVWTSDTFEQWVRGYRTAFPRELGRLCHFGLPSGQPDLTRSNRAQHLNHEHGRELAPCQLIADVGLVLGNADHGESIR